MLTLPYKTPVAQTLACHNAKKKLAREIGNVKCHDQFRRVLNNAISGNVDKFFEIKSSQEGHDRNKVTRK